MLFVLMAIAVITAIGLAAVGRLGELPEPQPDSRPLPDLRNGRDAPPSGVDGPEIAFDVVVRGYRMNEVDATITQLQERISELEAAAASTASDRRNPSAG